MTSDGTSPPRVRVGVAGAGWVAANRHLPCLQRLRGVEVAAVYDRTPARAATFADRFRIPLATDDVGRLLAADLDALVVCTPPFAHAHIVAEAFDAGCHVLCEKPLALSGRQAAELADRASAAGRILCVAHNQLFSRAVQKASGLLAGGVRQATAVQLSSDRRRLPAWYGRLPGGLFTDEAPHMLYLLREFLGPLRLDDVRGHLGGQQDWVDAGLSGARGPGRLLMTFGSPVSEWHLGLVGKHRIVDVDLFRDVVVHRGADGRHGPADVMATTLAATGRHIRGVGASGLRYATGRLFYGHDELVARFVGAVRGDGPNPVDPVAAVEISALAEEVVEALSTHTRT